MQINSDAVAEPAAKTAKQVLLALWSVPGIGPVSVEQIVQHTRGRVEQLWGLPVASWWGGLPEGSARRALSKVDRLEPLAERVEQRAARGGMRVVFRGEAGYPERLAETSDAPPLLFVVGETCAVRRRLAMVGSRKPDGGFASVARRFAERVARCGVGVVSGAAYGVDESCHLGALDAAGETWAFVGSALDMLEPAHQQLCEGVVDRGGAFLSELPPGVRAARHTFPRRNRLIAGSADAVLVLRAAAKSGALQTAEVGRALKRPVLALPGEITNEAAAGANNLIFEGRATLCRGIGDALRAVGLHEAAAEASARPAPTLDGLSSDALRIFKALSRQPKDFDRLQHEVALDAGDLAAGLIDLELGGLCIQRAGKLYEKV